jgi:hypothetical protein
MKTTIAAVIAVTALLLPVAALADDNSPTPATVASAACTQLKTSLGAETFAKTYGTNKGKQNAFGKCVAAQAKAAQAAIGNAVQSCKAQRTSDPAGFASKYGTNGKDGSKGSDRNALGRCVSAAVKEATTKTTNALTSAAKTCKAAMKADAAAFAAKYGKTHDAFGKCVAQTANTK